MKKFFLILCLTSYILCLYSQNEDYNWITGNGTLNQVSFSNTSYTVDTFTPNPILRITKTNASISDSLGNLLLFTGGAAIYDAQGNIVENGDSINPGYIRETWQGIPGAYPGINGTLFLPTYSKNMYYLFHSRGDTISDLSQNLNIGFGTDLFYSKINASINGDYIVEKKMFQL